MQSFTLIATALFAVSCVSAQSSAPAPAPSVVPETSAPVPVGGRQVECGNLSAFEQCKSAAVGENPESQCNDQREGNDEVAWYTCLCHGHSEIVNCFDQHCPGSADRLIFDTPREQYCAVIPEENRLKPSPEPQTTEEDTKTKAENEADSKDQETSDAPPQKVIGMKSIAFVAASFVFLM